jgi:predicted RNA-binding Zn ribbon-like protein
MAHSPSYSGPLRGQPLAIELHNTVYAVRGEPRDGLADQDGADAWVESIAPQFPPAAQGARVPAAALRELRAAVRDVLHAALDDAPPPEPALRALNTASVSAPRALVGTHAVAGPPQLGEVYPTAAPVEVALAALAASALELAGGGRRGELRSCGAPGCVLMFLKDHPRREWCSTTCGNRARQARFVARRRDREASVHRRG